MGKSTRDGSTSSQPIEAPPSGSAVDQTDSLIRRISYCEAELESLRRRVRQFDYDLQDAVDGFYRRRQSDRMREIRDEESAKRPKKLTESEMLRRALAFSETPETESKE